MEFFIYSVAGRGGGGEVGLQSAAIPLAPLNLLNFLDSPLMPLFCLHTCSVMSVLNNTDMTSDTYNATSFLTLYNLLFSSQGGKQLQVRLTIPWKHNVQIEYLALSVSEYGVYFGMVESN